MLLTPPARDVSLDPPSWDSETSSVVDFPTLTDLDHPTLTRSQTRFSNSVIPPNPTESLKVDTLNVNVFLMFGAVILLILVLAVVVCFLCKHRKRRLPLRENTTDEQIDEPLLVPTTVF
jgi:hypothetical protein